MRAKTIIPSFEALFMKAPQKIKDYINKCKDIPQRPDFHPEGNTWIHIHIVYDRAQAFGDLDHALAAFFHDLGKVDTTAPNKHGSYSAYGHELVSADLVKEFSNWIEELGGHTDVVYNIVKKHMKIKLLDNMRKSKQEILKQDLYFNELIQFSKFDTMETLTNDELNRYK